MHSTKRNPLNNRIKRVIRLTKQKHCRKKWNKLLDKTIIEMALNNVEVKDKTTRKRVVIACLSFFEMLRRQKQKIGAKEMVKAFKPIINAQIREAKKRKAFYKELAKLYEKFEEFKAFE